MKRSATAIGSSRTFPRCGPAQLGADRIHAPVKLLNKIHDEIFWRSLRTLQSQQLLDLGLGDSSFHDMAVWLASSAARKATGLLIQK